MEKNLLLNWEKCHFMMTHGIVLGHTVFQAGIAVDKNKVGLIENFPKPRNINGIWSFLGHVGFIVDLSKTFPQFLGISVICFPTMLILNGHVRVNYHLLI